MSAKNYIVKVMIPCYNVEKYISKCIDSVLKQNYNLKYVKIVCVDDGSTDNTLKILQEYKTRLGDNMELYTQKNKGLWTTRRNLLLDNKDCDYLVCLDGDDTWRKNFLKHCSEYFDNKPDVICLKKIHWQKSSGIWMIYDIKFKPNLNDYKGNGSGMMWDKVWNANFLKKYVNLIPKCDAKQVRCDDAIMNLILNSFVKTVKINKHMDYNYFYRKSSLMHNKIQKFSCCSFEACKAAVELLNKSKEIVGEKFDIHIFKRWLSIFGGVGSSVNSNYKNIVNK